MLFSNSPKTIMAELLQNSRRAGATRVEVDSDAEHLTISVTDNGCGMGEEELRTLMSLTGSGWSDEVMQEMPAGMGFLSLSSRGKVVVNTWRSGVCLSMCLFPEHFTGAEIDVTSKPTTSEGSGTTVTFAVADMQELRLFISEAEDLLAYCGIDTAQLYGIDAAQPRGRVIKRKDLCAGCDTVEYFEELGVRIGVSLPSEYWSSTTWVRVNFYGLQFDKSMKNGDAGILVSSHVNDAAVNVYIDVLNAKSVRLVLPARNELWRGDFAALHRAVDATVAKFAATHEHRIPHAQYLYFKTINDDVQEATKNLCLRQSSDHGKVNQSCADRLTMVVVSDDDPNAEYYAEDAGLYSVYASCCYEGYSWYKTLPQVSLAVCPTDVCVVREGLSTAEKIAANFVNAEGKTIASVDLQLHVSDTCDVYPQSWFDASVELLVKKSLSLNRELVEAAVELTKSVFFSCNDGSDSDSLETQENDFVVSATEYFEQLIIPPGELALSHVNAALAQSVGASESALEMFYSVEATKIAGGKLELKMRKQETAAIRLKDGDDGVWYAQLTHGDPPDGVMAIVNSVDLHESNSYDVAKELTARGLICVVINWREVEFTWSGASECDV
jgi:hypothetical protein